MNRILSFGDKFCRHMTLCRKPLEFSNLATPQFEITNIDIAIKSGMEINIGSAGITDPDSDCWFAIDIAYTGRFKKNGSIDCDTIITNGEQYFLCRRDLGQTPFALNDETKSILTNALKQYMEQL